jgi:hypothetical protein
VTATRLRVFSAFCTISPKLATESLTRVAVKKFAYTLASDLLI